MVALLGMMGALAPFSYLVLSYFPICVQSAIKIEVSFRLIVFHIICIIYFHVLSFIEEVSRLIPSTLGGCWQEYYYKWLV
jgi:hypothetical protein